MKRDQALEILRTINELYPRFELTERKIKALLPQLEKMDYDRVVTRLNEYMVSNPFPPTLADIAAYAPKENEHLKKMEHWKAEAAKVPEEKKQEFRNKLQQLIKDKGS